MNCSRRKGRGEERRVEETECSYDVLKKVAVAIFHCRRPLESIVFNTNP